MRPLVCQRSALSTQSSLQGDTMIDPSYAVPPGGPSDVDRAVEGAIDFHHHGYPEISFEQKTRFEDSDALRIASAAGLSAMFFQDLFGLVTLLFFMAKPLWPGRGDRDSRPSLSRLKEPTIFALVEEICRALGAPVPTEIVVDCDANAAASFRGGAAGMMRGELVLMIGLPLVAGLSAQEFAGVLAHEFGHFTQRAGMRLTWIVRSINAWFICAGARQMV